MKPASLASCKGSFARQLICLCNQGLEGSTLLPDETTRRVAELTLQGIRSLEIAKHLKIAKHAVDLELDMVLSYWKDLTDEMGTSQARQA